MESTYLITLWLSFKGQYQYIDSWGKDIQVQYWVDSLGFHQTDNIPKYDLQSVTDTPEVKKAREEHERLWKEAARLNGVDPDRNDLYDANAYKPEDDNDNGDQELEGQVSNQHATHISPKNAKSFGRVVGDSVIVDAVDEVHNRFARQQRNEVEEVTSEPRGFFYSFDYQVPFIVNQNSEAQASEQISKVLGTPISTDLEAHASDASINVNFEDVKFDHESKIQDQNSRVSENIRDKIIPEDEVHDVQTSPKQQISINSRSNDLRAYKPLEVRTSLQQKAIRNRGSVKFDSAKV